MTGATNGSFSTTFTVTRFIGSLDCASGPGTCVIGASNLNGAPAFSHQARAPLTFASAQTCAGLQPTIVGTPGNDVLVGTSGDDVIHGLGGDDTISGGAGADVICGGDGIDTISGGSGNDSLYGDAGSDVLQGDSGDDQLTGGAGDDALAGGSGNDVVSGDAGDDALAGGSGNDVVSGGSGNDALAGGSGNDALDGGPDSDQCDGGTGINTEVNCEDGTPITDAIIDADGTVTAQSGDPAAREVTTGSALANFPVQTTNNAGLDMFDQDSNQAWTLGAGGDDLHVEGPTFCPTAIRDGDHDLGGDCKVLDIDGNLADGQAVNCDLEFGISFSGMPCPPPGLRYYDANGNGAWDNGEDIVLDQNGNGVFD